jgi:hypothetical protein
MIKAGITTELLELEETANNDYNQDDATVNIAPLITQHIYYLL